MNDKKKILVFVDWYLPGYKAGGQIRSVASMVKLLSHEYSFSIITSDRDLHADAPYTNIQQNKWNIMEDGSKVYYFSPEAMTKENLKELIFSEQADVLYLNSLFSKFFTIYPLLIRKQFLHNRKVILAPRGMLGKGALAIKSTKKKTFLFVTKLTGLFRNIIWHASSELEEKEIISVFGKHQRIKQGIDLVEPRNLVHVQRKKASGILKIVFISRISQKKNLLGTIKLLNKINHKYKVVFDVYGPIEEQEYWEQCKTEISKLQPSIVATYKGVIENEKVISTLNQYHLSILLTFNENYGHTIVESMAAGCPVLISDQTIWKNLEQANAGWDIPLNEEHRIIEKIEYCCETNQDEYDKLSKGAIEYAKTIFNNAEGIAQNIALFK